MRGSATELKNFLGKNVNDKLKKHYAQSKEWYIVAFTSEWIVLRIDNENIKFNRKTARIMERFPLK